METLGKKYGFSTVERIEKGWSGEEKYHILTQEGRSLLLRLSQREQYPQKQKEFSAMQVWSKAGFRMTEPIRMGICRKQEKEATYMLLTWLEGEDLESLLPVLPVKEQYRLGVEAGEILRKIHSVPAPPEAEPWEARFNRKIDRKIAGYKACDIQIPGGQAFLDCIEENRTLLAGRPQVMQHGDYHCGNMVLCRDGKLGILDFNRLNWGDPWEEFNRIPWCAGSAGAFAAGRLDGYFTDEIPEQFWRLLELYISSNTISSVYWAVPFGRQEVEVMLNQARDILVWFDGMKNPVPSWYREYGKKPFRRGRG